MLHRHSLVVDGWSPPAHPSPSNRFWIGYRWALDGLRMAVLRGRSGPQFYPGVLRVEVAVSKDTV